MPIRTIDSNPSSMSTSQKMNCMAPVLHKQWFEQRHLSYRDGRCAWHAVRRAGVSQSGVIVCRNVRNVLPRQIQTSPEKSAKSYLTMQKTADIQGYFFVFIAASRRKSHPASLPRGITTAHGTRTLPPNWLQRRPAKQGPSIGRRTDQNCVFSDPLGTQNAAANTGTRRH